MEFDIVIITRNRKSLLPISIPLMLSQNRLPSRLIVVDSSDNHSEVRCIVEQIVCRINKDIKLEIIYSKPGTSYQRNIGLKYAKSPVVFFPDDDSLWYPGVSESTLQIYEKDKDFLIGAVSATPTNIPPPGIIDGRKAIYRLELRDRLAPFLQPIFSQIEKFVPDPLLNLKGGLVQGRERKLPVWLDEEDAKLLGFLTGFLMSFRTDLIRRVGFDELMGRYALFEDREASYGILKNHLIVSAKKAMVFHYRHPEKRLAGQEFGMMHILNRAYAVCKHSPPDSLERRMLKKFLYYKLVRYLFQAYTHYGRMRFKGACMALSKISQLLCAPQQEAPQQYKKLRSQCLARLKS